MKGAVLLFVAAGGPVVLAVIAFLAGNYRLAAMATPFQLLGFLVLLVWVALCDPKGRWPGASPSQRLVNLFMFKR